MRFFTGLATLTRATDKDMMRYRDQELRIRTSWTIEQNMSNWLALQSEFLHQSCQAITKVSPSSSDKHRAFRKKMYQDVRPAPVK